MKQLVKIIPLLGSDQSGEVVAAAAAIGRALVAAGKDWHWLAGTVNGTTPTPGQSSHALVDALKELARSRAASAAMRGENGRLLASVGRLEARLADAAIKITELQRRVVDLDAERQGRARVDAAAPLRDRPSPSQWEFRVGRMLRDDDFGDGINQRAYEFLCDVRDQLVVGRPPSAKQATWLDDLWNKYKSSRTLKGTRRAS